MFLKIVDSHSPKDTVSQNSQPHHPWDLKIHKVPIFSCQHECLFSYFLLWLLCAIRKKGDDYEQQTEMNVSKSSRNLFEDPCLEFGLRWKTYWSRIEVQDMIQVLHTHYTTAMETQRC
jgi:hypothetical protein